MKYAAIFLALALALTFGALATFDHIESSARGSALAAAPAFPAGDTVPKGSSASPLVPTRADYARFSAEDSVWRVTHARRYTVADLRKRGDGLPTARDKMNDRVFLFTKRGDRAAAIAELERWVAKNPRDVDALLSLARLLNAQGRTDAAVARYRQALALGGE